jgi:hypothetical protein
VTKHAGRAGINRGSTPDDAGYGGGFEVRSRIVRS